MAEIAEVSTKTVSKPLSKSLSKLKGKKVWIVGGIGAALVVLAYRGVRGQSAVVQSQPAADVVGGSQDTTVLGQQLQAFSQSVSENQASIVNQLENLQTAQTATDTASTISTTPDRYVYGATVDLDNARGLLGNVGYKYIDTTHMASSGLSLGVGDLVVGGIKAGGGVGDVNLNGATRVSGNSLEDTNTAIINYQKSIAQEIK